MEDKKPLIWMILFGVIRHSLGIIGTWLASRGYIDADTHSRLLTEGASEIVGYVLIGASILWSVAQKKQVGKWLMSWFDVTEAPPSSTKELGMPL